MLVEWNVQDDFPWKLLLVHICLNLSASQSTYVHHIVYVYLCVSACLCVWWMDVPIHPTWVPRFVPKRTKRRRVRHNTRNLERLYTILTTILFQVLVVQQSRSRIDILGNFANFKHLNLIHLDVSWGSRSVLHHLFSTHLCLGGGGCIYKLRIVCPLHVERSSKNQLLWFWRSCVCFQLCRIICWSCLVIIAGAFTFLNRYTADTLENKLTWQWHIPILNRKYNFIHGPFSRQPC